MSYAACIALVTFVLVTPLKAQENDQLEPMLQFVIDLTEMEQVLSDFRITEKLYLVQTPVLLPGIRLNKFGEQLEVTDEESAFFRSKAYVKFTEVSAAESMTVTASAFVSRPGMHKPGEGTEVSFVLMEQSDGWVLEDFRRSR